MAAKQKQFQPFVEAEMQWAQAEYDDEKLPELQVLETASRELVLSVTPTEWVVSRSGDVLEVLTWQWTVKLTSAVSETPELVSLGVSKSLRAAQRGARGAANKELVELKKAHDKAEAERKAADAKAKKEAEKQQKK